MFDVVEVIKRENITSFTKRLNQQDPNIQFRVETQSEDNNQQHLPVLDIDIQGWCFQIPCVPKEVTHRSILEQPPPHSSETRSRHTLFDSARTFVSDELDQQEEICNIKEALRHCDYLDWSFKLVEESQKEGKSKKKIEK